MFLTNRFTVECRDFLQRVAATEPQAAQSPSWPAVRSPASCSRRRGGSSGVPCSTWGRMLLDLLDAALGPVEEVSAVGEPTRMVALTTRHESGRVGQALLSITAPNAEGGLVCTVHTDVGPVVFDTSTIRENDEFMPTIASELAESVATGRPHPLDIRRGLMLQRLLDQAERSLG